MARLNIQFPATLTAEFAKGGTWNNDVQEHRVIIYFGDEEIARVQPIVPSGVYYADDYFTRYGDVFSDDDHDMPRVANHTLGVLLQKLFKLVDTDGA